MKKNLLMRSISTLLLSLLLVPMLPIQQAQASLLDDLDDLRAQSQATQQATLQAAQQNLQQATLQALQSIEEVLQQAQRATDITMWL